MYFPLFVGVLCLSLFCYALLFVHYRFAIILKRKRKLAPLLLSPYRCIVTLKCSLALPHGAVGWSAVFDCGISWLYSFTFLSMIFLSNNIWFDLSDQ